jgi:hypothetical protein
MNKIIHLIGKGAVPSMRMAYALTISIIADLLDYIGAPVLGAPIVGDLFDFIVITYLYSITKSKVVLVINLAEFVPFIGDFLPVYTVSTIIWILRETGYHDLISVRQTLRYITMFIFNSRKAH